MCPRRVQFSADTEGGDEGGERLHRHVLHTERGRVGLHRPDTAPSHHVSDRYVIGYTVTTSAIKCLHLLPSCRPSCIQLHPNQPTAVLEKGDFTYSFGFEANPTPTNFTWSRDGQVISSNGRIATSVSTVTITSTTRSDSGVYEVVSYNKAGRGTGNITLDVQCELLRSKSFTVCSVSSN